MIFDLSTLVVLRDIGARRDGRRARTIADKVSPADRDTPESAVELLRQLAES
jgi:hypothetical protein